MDIFFERHPVGSIQAAAEPAPVFRYAPEWLALPGAFPVSTTMPLSDRAFDWHGLVPWLVNLLPEDMDELRMMARILDVPHTDVLALLARVGRDTSGALSFSERGTTGRRVLPVETETELERILNELPARPFLVGEEGVSMSLAGVQSKLSVRLLDDGRIGIPVDGTPSSHILKPDSPDRLQGSVQNEAFCLTLAHRVGLPAAAVTTGRAGQRCFLMVERYDRVQEGDLLRRRHRRHAGGSACRDQRGDRCRRRAVSSHLGSAGNMTMTAVLRSCNALTARHPSFPRTRRDDPRHGKQPQHVSGRSLRGLQPLGA